MKLIRAHQLFFTHHEKNSSFSLWNCLGFPYSCSWNSIPIHYFSLSSHPGPRPHSTWTHTHIHLLVNNLLIYPQISLKSTTLSLPNQCCPRDLAILFFNFLQQFFKLLSHSLALALVNTIFCKTICGIPNFSILQLILLKNLLDAKSCLRSQFKCFIRQEAWPQFPSSIFQHCSAINLLSHQADTHGQIFWASSQDTQCPYLCKYIFLKATHLFHERLIW